MRLVSELIEEAREIIDGECDNRTPEYRALDKMERAIALLNDALDEIMPEIR